MDVKNFAQDMGQFFCLVRNKAKELSHALAVMVLRWDADGLMVSPGYFQV